MRPRLALVPGEPAGIGPELVVFAAQRAWDADLVIHGDAATLRRAAAMLQLPLQLHRSGETPESPRSLEIVDIRHPVCAPFGEPDGANAGSVIEALLQSGQACIDGRLHGLVTGPVHKAVINAGGIAFTGTTGLLADQAGCDVVMMLANSFARVALLTTHVPLREVADAITADALRKNLQIVHRALRDDFGIADPTIAVLGLNPHAGEGGHLGDEELRIIEPTLDALRATGMRLVGPLPADTGLLPDKLRGFDAVLAMYHDQGLPVLKYSDFANAVNISLGLPYPRVAVDHGTALELAGTGTADPSSLFAAIHTCTRMARGRMFS
ncbi:MAG: 4-hydroxythreonine-4-phosphate dehydrogenase PdxA [Pseudomonadota bacterium]|nr:4-hydroxythreonine-4-phosphate dehydrogenase PdxA [Pseudomonadota bacterium]